MEGSSVAADDSSTAESLRPVRTRRRVTGEKLCRVCGDKALAHHFGALACETCKAFFRRNALKQETRKCLFEGKCPVDKNTRRFCPPCRLQKCFAVGMQTDLILDEDERKERMQKVKHKRASQMKEETDRSSSHSSVFMISTSGHNAVSRPETHSTLGPEASAAVTQTGFRFAEVTQTGHQSSQLTEWASGTVEVVAKSHECQSGGQVTPEATYSSSCVDSTFIPDSSVASLVNSDVTAQLSASLKLSTNVQSAEPQPGEQENLKAGCARYLSALVPFEHIPRDQLPSDPFMYWRLSEEERSLLAKLSADYQDTVLSFLKNNPPRDYLPPAQLTNELFHEICDAEVRGVVSFVKRIEDFQRLCTKEQVALVKASSIQALCIRACALYISEKDAWLSPAGYFTIEHCRAISPDYPYLDVDTKYCKIIKDIVKNDFTLYALLHCLVLFDPSDEKVIDRQLISSIRDKYVILLRHYLESVYSYNHSEKYLIALLDKLLFQRNMHLENKPLYKKFFPQAPNQLILEVWDIDH